MHDMNVYNLHCFHAGGGSVCLASCAVDIVIGKASGQ